MNWTITLQEGILVTLGGAIVTGLFALVKMSFTLAKSINRLVESDAKRGVILTEIAAVQQPQLHGIQVSLEALKGECNGNVDTAHQILVAARERYNTFLAGQVGS